MGRKAKDITGQRFGMLVVLERDFTIDELKKNASWIVKCDCGRIHTTKGYRLRNGGAKSCGCVFTAHGHCRRKNGKAKTTPEYKTWRNIKSRCYNPNATYYEYYGGSGIGVCERWLESFENFLEDMGPRPSKTHSIERVDNYCDYGPKNCIWTIKKVQMANRRNSRILTFDGESMPINFWAERLGMKYASLNGRIRRGWSVERALTTPMGKSNIEKRKE